MTAPVPEDRDEPPLDDELTDDAPPGEHDDELPDASDGTGTAAQSQDENAETSQDQPSQ